MKLIEPMTVTEANLLDSNIEEDDHPEWDAGATYAEEARIILAAQHKVYESVQPGNLGKDPSTDDGTWWLEVSATNRWRAFDLVLGDKASRAGSIKYSLQPASLVTGIAFFGLNAGSVRVEIYDDGGSAEKVFDKAIDLVDETDVVDWFSFFLGGVSFDTEALMIGTPGYSGFRIDITIDAQSGNAEVGQVVLGELHTLGETIDGTTVGIEDTSIKDRDAFGNATIVERPFYDETEFQFAHPTDDTRRIKRILTRVRSKPAVYFVDEGAVRFGATVFGFFRDFSIPLRSGGTSFANLEIEGLT